MENKNIIIIMLVIIVILAAAIGFVMFNSAFAKEKSVVKITSDEKQEEGGSLAVRLTDLSDNPIDKEVVNVVVKDKKGDVVVDNVVKTDEKGKASSSSSSSQPTAYAYKSDGTPMYSQAEVDQYMYNKYGSVNYHLQDNGYVNLDEPGFDDAGHWVGR